MAIISEVPFFGFSDCLISEAGAKKRPERRNPGPPKTLTLNKSNMQSCRLWLDLVVVVLC